MLGEGIVKLELLIINILGNAVYSILALMYGKDGISTRDAVNFSSCQFLCEDRSLFDADTDPH